MCYAYPGSIPASPVNGSNITQAAIGVKHLVMIPLIVAGRPSPLGRLQLQIISREIAWAVNGKSASLKQEALRNGQNRRTEAGLGRVSSLK